MTAGELKRHFGAAVKYSRSQLGISQEELADRAGLHRTYVSDVERGARNISLESIEKLALALQLTVSGLFQRAGDGPNGGKGVEILLVEDEPGGVTLTLHAFQRARFTTPVHVVRDGAEALDFLFATGAYTSRRDRDLPSVVLLDLNLPKISGLEVLRRIRADRQTKHLPVVILTASQHDHHIAECQRLGIATYIQKPVDFQNFAQVTPQLRLDWALTQASAESPT